MGVSLVPRIMDDEVMMELSRGGVASSVHVLTSNIALGRVAML